MAHQKLVDNWGRPINYLRLAITDRCNLRCFYCMPEEGIKYLPKQALLTYEEMERLVSIFCQLGIEKIRITGGEPFVRKDLVPFLYRLAETEGLQTINITTNGLLTAQYLDDLKQIGVKSVNLSLDTLDQDRFKQITRRDEFEKVYETLIKLVDHGFDTKINMVVMPGKNIEDILPMAALSLKMPVSVRFIEEMPFNGSTTDHYDLPWSSSRIIKEIEKEFPLQKITDPKHATASHYKIPGSLGNVGVIAAYTRTFCGSCNRVRLTAQGELRTCLYANHGLDLKTLLRADQSDQEISQAIINAINNRHKDGFEAEKSRNFSDNWESMSTIGG
ncbi:GTP 3',8-cyclase MoaA [Fulvivirga sp. RKSG066]|uniref:GTP 3',8-cyclase MoaA n=1 Tax=Fulvivirga aurantia TaxID=2529383 RepID=UPI0012BBCC39|nr:GTP 3',8-cyclase MoaA [Fulvivirga aurantia]MTI22322.1 GTP 3',8-cyclase MoaA [Fulvivirga aurantia]